MYLRKKMRIIIHINFSIIYVIFQFGLLYKKTGAKLWSLNNLSRIGFCKKIGI